LAQALAKSNPSLSFETFFTEESKGVRAISARTLAIG
jgi:hypothetical protein